jgi:hypothetical protein
MDGWELQYASDSVRLGSIDSNSGGTERSVVLTLVVSTPQFSPVANFEGAKGGVAMKEMSPSSSSPWRFCEDIMVVLMVVVGEGVESLRGS